MMTFSPISVRKEHSPLPQGFYNVKMASAETEPFPVLQNNFSKKDARSNGSTTRRRKSSALGAESVGDTDVAAFATLGSPPATPVENSVCIESFP